MPIELAISCPLSLLTREADCILTAAEKHATILSPRLPANFIADKHWLLDIIRSDENVSIATLNDLVDHAQDCAQRAFMGNETKLRHDFQVGVSTDGDFASVLRRARIVLAGCKNSANVPVLIGKGWYEKYTNALTKVIAALDSAGAANQLYEALVTIQKVASAQWPDFIGANAVIRAKFRLGMFPPRVEKNQPVPMAA